MAVQFVDEAFPVVVFVCPIAFDAEATRALAEGFEALFRRERRYSLIVDTRPLKSVPNATDRKAITDWANRPDVRELTRARNAGSAVIIPNAFVRGALTAVQWVWSSPVPLHAPADFAGAASWSVQRAVDDGLVAATGAPSLQAHVRAIGARIERTRP